VYVLFAGINIAPVMLEGVQLHDWMPVLALSPAQLKFTDFILF
jgi:hypothetical protein